MEQHWTVEKNFGLMLALLWFLPSLFLFLVFFVNNILLSKPTQPAAFVLPGAFGFLTLIQLPKVIRSLKDFSIAREYKVDDSGVYFRDPQKANDFLLIPWSQIRQYDTVTISNSTLRKLQLRTDHQDEDLDVIAPVVEFEMLTQTLKNKQIPFGYVREG